MVWGCSGHSLFPVQELGCTIEGPWQLWLLLGLLERTSLYKLISLDQHLHLHCEETATLQLLDELLDRYGVIGRCTCPVWRLEGEQDGTLTGKLLQSSRRGE